MTWHTHKHKGGGCCVSIKPVGIIVTWLDRQTADSGDSSERQWTRNTPATRPVISYRPPPSCCLRAVVVTISHSTSPQQRAPSKDHRGSHRPPRPTRTSVIHGSSLCVMVAPFAWAHVEWSSDQAKVTCCHMLRDVTRGAPLDNALVKSFFKRSARELAEKILITKSDDYWRKSVAIAIDRKHPKAIVVKTN